MPRRLVLLSGYLQSGKDTVGQFLCTHFQFTRVAFADALKDEVAQLYNVRRTSLDDDTEKQKSRALLIAHGKQRRTENLNYWIDRVVDKIHAALATNTSVVITDWRFENEYRVIHDMFKDSFVIETWRITRWASPPLIDDSECGLDAFFFTRRITNTGTLDDLYKAVASFVLAANNQANTIDS